MNIAINTNISVKKKVDNSQMHHQSCGRKILLFQSFTVVVAENMIFPFVKVYPRPGLKPTSLESSVNHFLLPKDRGGNLKPGGWCAGVAQALKKRSDQEVGVVIL